jgi:hypothetical protein
MWVPGLQVFRGTKGLISWRKRALGWGRSRADRWAAGQSEEMEECRYTRGSTGWSLGASLRPGQLIGILLYQFPRQCMYYYFGDPGYRAREQSLGAICSRRRGQARCLSVEASSQPPSGGVCGLGQIEALSRLVY